MISETRYSEKGTYAGGLQGKYFIFPQEGILVLNLKGHCHASFAVLSLKNETRYLIQEKISILKNIEIVGKSFASFNPFPSLPF